MRNCGGGRGSGTSKMQHIQMIKFQLFIPFNIFSLYIFLTVQILIILASKMLDP